MWLFFQVVTESAKTPKRNTPADTMSVPDVTGSSYFLHNILQNRRHWKILSTQLEILGHERSLVSGKLGQSKTERGTIHI